MQNDCRPVILGGVLVPLIPGAAQLRKDFTGRVIGPFANNCDNNSTRDKKQ